MSLAHSSVATMLPISDAARAQEFYTDRLGLPFEGTNEEGSLVYTLQGGTQLVLLPRPDGQRSDSTAMSWEVADIKAEIRELQGRGVEFLDYDLPELKTVDHVCVMGAEKAAWFSDPDGNVLCLHQGG
jgi:catechol 2,3-dioxygenase-like lactoylglutathione lyase family enzyme